MEPWCGEQTLNYQKPPGGENGDHPMLQTHTPVDLFDTLNYLEMNITLPYPDLSMLYYGLPTGRPIFLLPVSFIVIFAKRINEACFAINGSLNGNPAVAQLSHQTT